MKLKRNFLRFIIFIEYDMKYKKTNFVHDKKLEKYLYRFSRETIQDISIIFMCQMEDEVKSVIKFLSIHDYTHQHFR